MKNLILLIALFAFIANVNAQDEVSLPEVTKQIQPKLTPYSTDSLIYIVIDAKTNMVKINYYNFSIIDDTVYSNKKRNLDLFFPFVKSDWKIPFQKYKARLEEMKL